MQSERGELRSRLEELLKEHDVPGAVLGTVTRGAVTTAAAGLLSRSTRVEVTSDSLFQIGSITKIWTATLVMQLVDDGLVDLDCPIQHYVPEFTCADSDAARVITVRQLLCHTSGIDGDFFQDFGRGDDCIDRYVRGMAGLPLVTPPGSVSSYCNAGYVALGRLVENLRHMTWDEAVEQQLVKPLDLRQTVTLPEDALRHRVAVGHVPSPSGPCVPVGSWSLPRALGPAGLLTTSAADLLVFAGMHMHAGRAPDGRRVLTPASVHEMQRRQSVKPDAPNGTRGGGLGWVLSDWGTDVLGHDGGTVGQFASLRVFPEHDFAAAVLTNGSRGLCLAAALLDDVCRTAIGAHAPPAVTKPLTEVDPTSCLGTYTRTGAEVVVSLDDSSRPQLSVRSEGVLALHSETSPPQPLVMLTARSGRTVYPDMDIELPVAFSEPHPGRGFELLHFAGRVHRRSSIGTPPLEEIVS